MTGAAEGPSPGSERRAVARDDPDRRLRHDEIFSLAREAERHDQDTGDHVLRIRFLVSQIAVHLGHPDAEELGYDAMLHDVGKLQIPVEILQKPGPLTGEERRVMESHTVLGEQYLLGLGSMPVAARIARGHHECWDGSGYPDGLRGDAIPLEARITAAADVLDALVAERCYKEAWPYQEALERVIGLGGTTLDPHVVAALERCDDDGTLVAVLFGEGGSERVRT